MTYKVIVWDRGSLFIENLLSVLASIIMMHVTSFYSCNLAVDGRRDSCCRELRLRKSEAACKA